MPPRIKALAKPELLVWARERARLTVDQAASRARVTPERLLSWEEGSAQPTVTQLRKLARVYRRPLAVFFLPEPPATFDALRDFRRLPEAIPGTESPNLSFEIRVAHYRREAAIELYHELDDSPPQFTVSANISQDPEVVAANLRAQLGVTRDIQARWRDAYSALNGWKEALETIGVLVFQIPGVDITEMRGFSIDASPLPVVAVNIKDAPRGRIFSILHEFAHLAIKHGGLCDITHEGGRSPHEEAVEVFCNRVAGAILVPMYLLLQHPLVVDKQGDAEWNDTELDVLVRNFSASREAILRRLLIAGRTTEDFYKKKREEYREEHARAGRARGFATPHARAVSRAGRAFTRLVLTSYYQERITSSDVSDLLDIRLKHLPAVEEAVFGQGIGSGALA